MVDAIAFQTRARTIDHLGREQIADCPTAVSELWKNSYDAYARNVSLNIYGGDTPIATIGDNGHGMNREEFTNRWLVVGTESKATQAETSEEDRDGLEVRTKQGQKGIGRLSSANLGSLLLIVSKRRDDRFVAALIDWRLFENPYLFLIDVEIPVVEFDEKYELLPLIPKLFDKLMGNLWGNSISEKRSERDIRIENSWKQFDLQEKLAGKLITTKAAIESTLIDTIFDERHFSEWPLWRGTADKGTILAISNIQFDLQAQLTKEDPKKDSAVTQAREQLFQTLSNFSDPFLNEEERLLGYAADDFATQTSVWDGNLERRIIEEGAPFDYQELQNLEHVVDGWVDENGYFHGRIKAFGNWVEDVLTIPPAIDVPVRKDSLVGPFRIRIGTFEQDLSSTSLSDEAFRKAEAQSEKYSGFLMYRNGLRVMPYGREGSDFFRIEYRRSKHAGREFWSLRQLFGRIALRIETNPNLRDKAGREGLIDNRAAKSLRDLVENILKFTARNYFGSDAKLRKRTIPDKKLDYKKKKAEEARNKQKALSRKNFISKLDKSEPILLKLLEEISRLVEIIRDSELDNENEIVSLRLNLQGLRELQSELALGEAPRKLGILEDRYLTYRKYYRSVKEKIELAGNSLDSALERIKPRSLRDLALSELSSNAAYLHRRIRNWAQEAKNILSLELERISELQTERNKTYHAKMLPFLDHIDHGTMTLTRMTRLLESERIAQDEENFDLFEPYISALNSLRESVDLAGLASFSQDKADELREEVDRLHSLAQLGITVEIIGHEIEGLEQSVTTNLKLFPSEVRNSNAYIAVRDGHEALVERLRFLSPLKLSGPKTRVRMTGEMIFQYVQRFFKSEFSNENIVFSASKDFLDFSLFEYPARIYPVFINLVNNATYWASHSNSSQKEVLLDIMDEKIVVADSGPGVDEEDLKHLFNLFFTRKVRGGRGVGLYLCKTNLAAGGHSITYATDSQKRLSGANFILEFKGAKYA
ncbi:Signal transduction histidine kinase [Janthinobacterium sp. OK676]|uniref:ATP-binding protein n=1 Tax=Janthinobacterium sp. OK676 TaxID=1855295 RepID=UPI00088C6B79|nr:ATP-binding protein [Janthinobacterium sp. OK676]SDM64239.1 Signal transduction histidine kinase [Janthinobacterium sp. OK676]